MFGRKMGMAAKKAGAAPETELPAEQLELLRQGVRSYMRENRVTQAAIGELANGLGQSAISAFMNGGGIKLVNALSLAKAIGVELTGPIPVSMSAALQGTSKLTGAVSYATRLEEIDLAVAIGECADSALRVALKDFYRGRSDADATATVKHYLYGLDRSAERAKTEREWSDEVRAYYNRIHKGAASPFGR